MNMGAKGVVRIPVGTHLTDGCVLRKQKMQSIPTKSYGKISLPWSVCKLPWRP
jgi:hypothetical protein